MHRRNPMLVNNNLKGCHETSKTNNTAKNENDEVTPILKLRPTGSLGHEGAWPSWFRSAPLNKLSVTET